MLDFCENPIRQRAPLFAKAIEYYGASPSKCFGILDCSKIPTYRLEGNCSKQRWIQYEHKRIHCLINQKITTLDIIVFVIYGPEEGDQYDLNLLRKSG